MGGAHSRMETYIASPTSPPYVGKLTIILYTVDESKEVYQLGLQVVNLGNTGLHATLTLTGSLD